MASASASHEIVNCVVMPKIQTAHILETVCKIADEIGGRIVGEEGAHTHTLAHKLARFGLVCRITRCRWFDITSNRHKIGVAVIVPTPTPLLSRVILIDLLTHNTHSFNGYTQPMHLYIQIHTWRAPPPHQMPNHECRLSFAKNHFYRFMRLK